MIVARSGSPSSHYLFEKLLAETEKKGCSAVYKEVTALQVSIKLFIFILFTTKYYTSEQRTTMHVRWAVVRGKISFAVAVAWYPIITYDK